MNPAELEKSFLTLIALFRDINLSLIGSWWLTIVVGMLLCFFGVRIFSTSAFWFAVLVGGAIGFGIGDSLFGLPGGAVGAVGLGIVCGLLIRAVVRIGFFLGGLFAGGLIGTGLLGNSLWVIPIIVISGLLSLVLYRCFIILTTAVWGAVLLTDSAAGLLGISAAQYPYAVMTLKLGVCLAGILCQAEILKRPADREV